MKTIYLTLKGSKQNYELNWSYDKRSWDKVTESSPSTQIDPDEELDWECDDDTIKKIQIKCKKGNIIPNGNISGNESKKVKGRSKKDCWDQSDNYTIKVQPADGGGLKEYDPELKTPPKDDDK